MVDQMNCRRLTAAFTQTRKLSDIDKMNHLKSLLDGPAAVVATKGLTLTSTNYNTYN